jgi:DNA-binding transcriptional ArsR family regulator
MENSEVTSHEVRVYRVLQGEEWLTAAEVSTRAGVAPRTARRHCKRLKDLGLVDIAEVFPGHRYRVSKHAKKRNAAYVLRLERAAAVLGMGSKECAK